MARVFDCLVSVQFSRFMEHFLYRKNCTKLLYPKLISLEVGSSVLYAMSWFCIWLFSSWVLKHPSFYVVKMWYVILNIIQVVYNVFVCYSKLIWCICTSRFQRHIFLRAALAWNFTSWNIQWNIQCQEYCHI